MNPKRAFYLMLGILILAIVAVLGGAYGISDLLQGQSTKLVAAKAKLAAINQEQLNLESAKKDIQTYTPLYNIAQSIVPENKDQAETVRQIVKLAAASNVSLQSITFPSSSLGSGGTTSSTITTAPTANSAANNPNASTNVLSQLTPVTSIPGVYVMPITITSATGADQTVTYPQLISFLQGLESNRLTALVSNISIQPSTAGGSAANQFTFNLTLNIYIKPGA